MNIMTTITISKELKKSKELVTIPRRTYEQFLEWQRKIKSVKTYTPTLAEKRALARARKNLAQGKFMTIEELRHELGIKDR